MIIAITGLTGIKDAVVASGIKTFIEGMGFDIAVGVEGATAPGSNVASAPPAEIVAPVAVARRVKKGGAAKAAKPAPMARKTPVKRAASEPAIRGGVDPRGSIRDAVRASLNTAGKDLTTIVQEVQRTFPEKNRDYIGTVCCQLSKGGECEMGEDGKWRKSVK